MTKPFPASRLRRIRSALSWLAFSWASVPHAVLAQDAEAQAAEALFRQGVALMEAEDYAPACEKLAASHALDPGVGTLLHLGDCYERSGRLASALDTFEAAADLARARDDAAREHVASVRAAALEPRAPTLEVRARDEGVPADLQITVNGSPFDLRTLGHPIPRDAGRYEIRFSAPGYESFVSQVQLRNGEERGAVVSVPRLVASSRRAPAPRELERSDDLRDRGGGQRTFAWIAGASGVGFGLAAGVLSFLAARKNDDSVALCDPADPNRCGADGARLREDAQNLATLATVAGVLAGVGLGGGLVLYLTAPGDEPERSAGIAVSGAWF